VNQKITDLVSKAETDQADYRQAPHSINVFFGPRKYFRWFKYGSDEKYLVDFDCSVLVFNTAVLLGFTAICLGMLHLSLRRQLSTKA
jgi:hypothetical protein